MIHIQVLHISFTSTLNHVQEDESKDLRKMGRMEQLNSYLLRPFLRQQNCQLHRH